MFGKKQLQISIIKNLGLALLLLVAALTAIYILSGQISRLSRNIIQNRTALTMLENKSQVAEELEDNFMAIGEGDKKIEDALIEAGDIARFIDELDGIAKKNNLEQDLRFSTPTPVKTMTTDKTTQGLSLTKVDYAIDLQGDVTSLNNYLHELELAPYFSNVKSITVISLSTATNWKKVASVSIEAQLYLKQ